MNPRASLPCGARQMWADATPFGVGQIRRVSFALHSAERRPPSRLMSTFQTVSEKLFGKSDWVPNRGVEGRHDGAKEPRSATSCRQRPTVEKSSAIFQTVSEEAFSEVRTGLRWVASSRRRA